MRFGLTLLTDVPWAEAAPRWSAVEEMGFDHGWTFDHLVWGGLPESPWVGAVPTLAAAAARTSRIGLGTLVASPNFRHPYPFFRDVQALEAISDGRLLLGLGTGGDLDSQVLGGEELSVKERVDRFQEFVDTLRLLRDGDHVTSEGRWFTTVDARTLPGLTRTPYLVAANGPRSMRYAARAGDGWVTIGPPGSLELDDWLAGLAGMRDVFEEALAAAGREADDVRRYVVTDAVPHLSTVSRYALSGVGFFEELAGRIAELGFTDLITHWPRAEDPFAGSLDVLEKVAADVLPGLRTPRG